MQGAREDDGGDALVFRRAFHGFLGLSEIEGRADFHKLNADGFKTASMDTFSLISPIMVWPVPGGAENRS